jgi:hypothetical protein
MRLGTTWVSTSQQKNAASDVLEAAEKKNRAHQRKNYLSIAASPFLPSWPW